VWLSGALKRNENHFLCMHATKYEYEYANTTPPSGAPRSRAICLHHCQLQVVVLQYDGRRCGGQASGTGRSVATAAAARNWVTKTS